MFENLTLLKGTGCIAAVGTIGGGGYYTYTLLRSASGSEPYLLFVTTEAVATNDTEELYKTKEGSTQKEKNYKCVVGTENYDCDLIKEIATITNKQITFNSIVSNVNIDQNLSKTNLKTKDKFFLLKTDKKLFDLVLKTPNSVIEVKENKADSAKVFGKLKFISGKQEDKVLGPVSYFLSKVFEIKDATTFNITDSKQYKCSFDETTNLKDCEIHKFTDSQTPSGSNVLHTTLTFNGKANTEKLTSSSTIKQYEYYLVKFTTPLEDVNTYQNKLNFFETSAEANAATKNVITFSPINASVIFPKTAGSTDNISNLLIF